MPQLSLCLLGSFRVTLGDRPVTSFESDKVRALLAYLAVESDRPHRRETLVGLLWPDWPERNARKNLSHSLYELRAAIGDREAEPPFLLITPQTLQFNRESDYLLDTATLTDRPGSPSRKGGHGLVHAAGIGARIRCVQELGHHFPGAGARIEHAVA